MTRARAGGLKCHPQLAHRASPVFQQQSPQHVGPVLGLDLVRDDHLLHHLVGHARQGLLIQVQEHGPWNEDDTEGPHPQPRNGGLGWERGDSQGGAAQPRNQ